MYLRNAVLAGILGLSAATVWAHGDSGHAKPKAVDYSKAEETPFGRAGNPKTAIRTIRVGMHDTMRFVTTASAPRESGDLMVKKGETVRFVLRNDGKVMHEMVIGTMKELKEHAALMRKFPNMEHEEAYMSHVAPGKEGEIVWQFTRAGEFHYACLIPGHMEAGMIAKITVR